MKPICKNFLNGCCPSKMCIYRHPKPRQEINSNNEQKKITPLMNEGYFKQNQATEQEINSEHLSTQHNQLPTGNPMKLNQYYEQNKQSNQNLSNEPSYKRNNSNRYFQSVKNRPSMQSNGRNRRTYKINERGRNYSIGTHKDVSQKDYILPINRRNSNWTEQSYSASQNCTNIHDDRSHYQSSHQNKLYENELQNTYRTNEYQSKSSPVEHGTPVCRYYMKGGCRLNNFCRFSHQTPQHHF